MTKSKAKALGEDVFFNTPAGVAYLGTEWASNSVVRSDLVVSHFLDSVGGYRHKSRRDRLLNILDVDLDWHMHQISDGERRRVQIVQGLMAPWNLLLLDEVTVDLDVMVRQELLQFLIEDTKTRDCTVVYATHIFDGLDNFPTHVCHLQIGSTTTPKPIPWPISPETAVQNDRGIPEEALHEIASPDRIGSKLLVLALHWLKEDRLIRLKLEAQGDPAFKKRGALPESSVPTDSEVFYRKYDYTNSA
ncbi:CCR4-NOT regulatory complex component, variant 2 [Puccinia graminis f. sp. tritici]|nr:CCR4-NOT regulatory complex component, variant 2 [Puccinia graminis f. sp. tritici]KAA1103899.1 CCR4-NOT regulatory complex component, variant 2 [Puccinia graminis f. sp. tritici]